MPALSFKQWLAPKVTDGTKPHTIRAFRSRPFVTDDALMLYHGARLSPKPLPLPERWCTGPEPHHGKAWLVQEITLLIPSRAVAIVRGAGYAVEHLSAPQIDALATRDGFPDVGAFWDFFSERGTHFSGQLIWFQDPRAWGYHLTPTDTL